MLIITFSLGLYRITWCMYGRGMNEYKLALYMVMHEDWYNINIHNDEVDVYRYYVKEHLVR